MSSFNEWMMKRFLTEEAIEIPEFRSRPKNEIMENSKQASILEAVLKMGYQDEENKPATQQIIDDLEGMVDYFKKYQENNYK